jgi:hypothetical protein
VLPDRLLYLRRALYFSLMRPIKLLKLYDILEKLPAYNQQEGTVKYVHRNCGNSLGPTLPPVGTGGSFPGGKSSEE